MHGHAVRELAGFTITQILTKWKSFKLIFVQTQEYLMQQQRIFQRYFVYKSCRKDRNLHVWGILFFRKLGLCFCTTLQKVTFVSPAIS